MLPCVRLSQLWALSPWQHQDLKWSCSECCAVPEVCSRWAEPPPPMLREKKRLKLVVCWLPVFKVQTFQGATKLKHNFSCHFQAMYLHLQLKHSPFLPPKPTVSVWPAKRGPALELGIVTWKTIGETTASLLLAYTKRPTISTFSFK